MRKLSTLLAAMLLLCAISQATTKTVISNNDQGSNKGWQNPNNWLPYGMPQTGDVVLIPAGMTITVKGSVYSGPAADLTIYIYGTLDFDPSGKLNLGTRSAIQLHTALSRITSNGSASEQIIIGGGIKYSGQNDGEVRGPAFTNYAAPNSRGGTLAAAFFYGVLPVSLSSFTVEAQNNAVKAQWVTEQEEGLKNFELERSADSRDWKVIVMVQPKNNCNCATAYYAEDKAPLTGNNYYRLRSNYKDGSFTYSNVATTQVAINQPGKVKWFITPDQSQLQFSIRDAGIAFPLRVQLISSNGQVIREEKFNDAVMRMDINMLPTGIALLALEDANGKKYITKVVK